MAELDAIRAVKRAARYRLLAIPGVHAVGVGSKTVAGQLTGQPAIIVFVVQKKPLAEVPPSEVIPEEIDGFPTDVLESAIPGYRLDPIDETDVNDTEEYRPKLIGGSQITMGLADYVGTLGCFGVLGDNRVVGLTNWHVTGTPVGRSTSLNVEVAISVPGYRVKLSSLDEDGNPLPKIKPQGSLLYVNVWVSDGAWDVYVATAPDETPASLAQKLLSRLQALPTTSFIASMQPGSTTSIDIIQPSGFPMTVEAAGLGVSVPYSDASLKATVAIPKITFSGSVADNFYGVHVTVNITGADQPSRGAFVGVNKGETLAGVATKVAGVLMNAGVSAEASGAVVTVKSSGVDHIECLVWRDTRVGQDDNGFASKCSLCCSDRIGLLAAARFALDAAIIQIDPQMSYYAEVKGIGHLTGSRTLTDADVLAGLMVYKRGRTSGLRCGRVKSVDTDGYLAPNVDSSKPGLGRYAFRRYVDIVAIQEEPTDPPMTQSGDSGSVIVDVQGSERKVVALLFGGPEDPNKKRGLTLATPIQPILDTFAMTIATATADGELRPVPSIPNTASRVAGFAPERIYPNWERIREVEHELGSTPEGDADVKMVRRHMREAARLVNQNRKVGAVWQRNAGPLLVRAVLDCIESPERPLPMVLAGRPLDECLRAIADAFRRFGSASLTSELDRFMEMIEGFGGKTYFDVLERLGGRSSKEAGAMAAPDETKAPLETDGRY